MAARRHNQLKKSNMQKKTLIIVAITLFTVVTISLVGNIITIGDKAAEIHPWLGYGFYGVLGLFILRFIVWPTLKFLFTPELKGEEREKLEQMDESELSAYIRKLHLTQQEKEIFSTGESALEGTQLVLKHRDDQANKVIRRAALNVFIITGISQNGALDIITAFGMNIQMINRIVNLRHRRPSLTQLIELYVIIISTTLLISIADDILDEIDTSEIFGSVAGSLAKTLVTSAANGGMNAYLTLRIGKMTMRYLEMGSRYFKQNRQKIRKQARRQALKEIPAIAKSGVESIASAVKDSAADKLHNLNPLKKREMAEEV